MKSAPAYHRSGTQSSFKISVLPRDAVERMLREAVDLAQATKKSHPKEAEKFSEALYDFMTDSDELHQRMVAFQTEVGAPLYVPDLDKEIALKKKVFGPRITLRDRTIADILSSKVVEEVSDDPRLDVQRVREDECV